MQSNSYLYGAWRGKKNCIGVGNGAGSCTSLGIGVTTGTSIGVGTDIGNYVGTRTRTTRTAIAVPGTQNAPRRNVRSTVNPPRCSARSAGRGVLDIPYEPFQLSLKRLFSSAEEGVRSTFSKLLVFLK